jgi:hypothetical protein
MASHIGLTSDKNLAVDAPSVEWIEKYAADQAKLPNRNPNPETRDPKPSNPEP